ncbi:NAD(P)H-binding protein [Pendulispora rubella]|uniref:NAD(P)H-binding protein n=1 Tax=Pendulispora rubella TaxID=2741070 RepID=A0ABZ2L1U3_9BACT
MYAITGITGKVGGNVARTLLAAGKPVRAIVRDAGKGEEWARLGCEVALATVEDSTALARALEGATAAFILPPPAFDPQPGFPEARALAQSFVRALTLAKPARALYLSTIGADAPHENLLSQHTLIEAALGGAALPLTILRPAWFLENAAWDVPTARDAGMVPSYLQPLDKPFPMVAIKDVGRVAAELLQETWTGQRIVELEGPTRVSPNDLARALGRALGKPVHATAVPPATWQDLFLAQGMKNPGPRVRMLEGFNEGWIEFRGGGKEALKGRIPVDAAIAALVTAQS